LRHGSRIGKTAALYRIDSNDVAMFQRATLMP